LGKKVRIYYGDRYGHVSRVEFCEEGRGEAGCVVVSVWRGF
jgi:hypothetical protein